MINTSLHLRAKHKSQTDWINETRELMTSVAPSDGACFFNSLFCFFTLKVFLCDFGAAACKIVTSEFYATAMSHFTKWENIEIYEGDTRLHSSQLCP